MLLNRLPIFYIRKLPIFLTNFMELLSEHENKCPRLALLLGAIHKQKGATDGCNNYGNGDGNVLHSRSLQCRAACTIRAFGHQNHSRVWSHFQLLCRVAPIRSALLATCLGMFSLVVAESARGRLEIASCTHITDLLEIFGSAKAPRLRAPPREPSALLPNVDGGGRRVCSPTSPWSAEAARKAVDV